ncbi:hypothetical protein niasHT_024532 [Heterodera trifolii]
MGAPTVFNFVFDPITLEEALIHDFLHPSTGKFYHSACVDQPISLGEALRRGFIKLPSLAPGIALTLTDCVMWFLNQNTGKFSDRFSDDQFSLFDAIHQPRPLVKNNVREIIDMANNRRLTVVEAEDANMLRMRVGRFINSQEHAEMSLHDAYQLNLIQKPQTLTEVIESGSLDNENRFIDGVQPRTLLEAISSGMLDSDVAHIKAGPGDELISIGEALKRGRLTPQGKVVLSLGGEVGMHGGGKINLFMAHERDLLTSRVRHTIFDVKGVRNAADGSVMSFKEARDAGILQLQFDGLETRLSEAAARGEINPGLAEILVAPCGLSNSGLPLSLVRAFLEGRVDEVNGEVIDPGTGLGKSILEAYNVGSVVSTLRAAMRFAALLDVHPSLCQ